MKLRWVPNGTLSLLRCIDRIDRMGQLPDAALQTSFEPFVASMRERLVSASVKPRSFWDRLIDDVVAEETETAVTPAMCEIALLKSGVSQFQSDQVAAAIHRGIESCRRSLLTKSPRLSEQLKLRISPLQQSYQAYGPGLVRSIGHRIWNGPPPTAWWPTTVTVHAALPISAGGAGFASESTSIWIEAVLTDIDPAVPEWLRLVYQLSCLALDAHTRTNVPTGLANVPTGLANVPTGLANVPTGLDDLNSPSELPWSLALVPIVLAQAADMGAVTDEPLPIQTAMELWLGQSDLAPGIAQWWEQVGQKTTAMPLALKQLTAILSPSGSSEG